MIAKVALGTLAQYLRDHSDKSVSNGPRLLTHLEAQCRQERIAARIKELDELANETTFGSTAYRRFEEILIKLRDDGIFSTNGLVSDVAAAVA